ncbi:hypothetical protein ABID22_003619 [Pontibacter aydingkolensis]|uniref:Uncharacterized protein n=1 Tax=Pontibacter aydingkolensis TaxID=1911536 RepID=A0ABS7CZI2_9BACT|nr:hypothetical protein [Pontibacter aydingkolensis]MBW7468927.1 hypothetical protein [Pontibacter aydingkolensis]
MPLNPEKLPLYQKGQEIFDITSKIIDLIQDDDPILSHIKGMMLEDAAMLTVKVSGAEAGDLYDIRMESAALIRKAARELGTHCTTLEMFGFPDTQYLVLIREALEVYKLLFREWVQGFDPWNYTLDDWGLFNPPGIHPEE